MARKDGPRLNVQGLARRSPELVGCILPEPGHVTVSIDLSAGEPTCTTHFSGDANYKYACFDGVGKDPEYRDGILYLDDLYLMVMSVSPVGKDRMYEAFRSTWPAGSFVDQWRQDSEIIKKALKKERQIHKILALGLGYSMSPKKMVKTAYENGYDLSFRNAKAFYNAYWELFAGVRAFSNKLAAIAERDTYIINPFGYRLKPEPRKAFNYYIQSSVSGIMHVFTAKLMALAPYATWVTCIHDELLVDVPVDRVDEFRRHKDQATDSLNEDLKWTVNIRTGFAVGTNWYEAK